MAEPFRLGLRDRDTWGTVLVVGVALALWAVAWTWALGPLGPLLLLLPVALFVLVGLLAPRRWLAVWLTATAGAILISSIAGEVATAVRDCRPQLLDCDAGGFAAFLFGSFTILACGGIVWGSVLRANWRRRGLNSAESSPP